MDVVIPHHQEKFDVEEDSDSDFDMGDCEEMAGLFDDIDFDVDSGAGSSEDCDSKDR